MVRRVSAGEIEGQTEDRALRQRSVRTLAWIGDAEFEREVRLRLSRRGDFKTDKLDKMRAKIVNAGAQAELLAGLLDAETLDERELNVVGRGRNTALRKAGHRRGTVREYRASTALEALIAWWILGGERARFDALVAPAIEAAIDRLLSE